ncbi:hypothetical protein HYS95_00555 [Candidatus Daviesbacteria bacterium]|nr:hypothetical protein [Candidatus Daviesbacteria bacterium]
MRNKGGSLIEVTIATTVGILVVSALTFATIFSLRNANFAKSSAQATKLAQDGIERVRTLRDRNGAVNYTGSPGASEFDALWSVSFSCPSNCYFYFDALGKLSGGTASNFEVIAPDFKRQFKIEDSGSEQKKITVIVRWTDQTGDHDSKLTTILRKL